jgi:dTDP-4-dehydrorhamnose 3,5-epimerase
MASPERLPPGAGQAARAAHIGPAAPPLAGRHVTGCGPGAPAAGACTVGNQTAWRFQVEGPVLVASRRFGDSRGFFAETYSSRDFAALGMPETFVQDNHSRSAAAGTIRGMHFQLPPHAQAKLVRVLRGAVLDIAVDLRRSSPSFGRHLAVELSEANALQFYIPAGFAHGFCTLESETEVIYKVSDFYAADLERSVAWDDPDLALPWPCAAADRVLSEKDRRAPRLRDLPRCFD